jgi:hypothetical protein
MKDALAKAVSPEMKDAFAKMVSPEMKDAFTEIARRLQQPFQEEPGPLAATPEAPTSEPTSEPSSEPSPSQEPSTQETPSPKTSTPEVSTAPAPTPASLQTSQPHRGEQRDRVRRILRKRYSDGKVPRGITGKAVWKMVCDELAAEKKAGQAPTNEEGWPDPSQDTVARAMAELGRSA